MEVSNARLHLQVAAMADDLPLEEDLAGCPKLQQRREEEEKKRKKMTSTKPEVEESIKCPRCDSANTKFCYYNNYSLSQPRYFCKGCRRYWTKGGSLRNVPVGGGCRKTKKLSSSASSPSCKRSTHQDHLHHQLYFPFINSPANCTPLLPPLLPYDHLTDLGSAMAGLQKQQQLLSSNNGEESSFLLGNPNQGVLLSMLRTDQGLFGGYGTDEEMAAAVSSLPCGGGATEAPAAATVTSTANEGGDDAELGEGGDCGNNLGCDYWNNGGLMCSSWQSLISSSSFNHSNN